MKFKNIYNPDLEIIKNGWLGNIWINGRFYNDVVVEKPPLKELLKWKFSRNPQKDEKKKELFQLQSLPYSNVGAEDNSIVWLGHASFLIQIDGVRLLTDPCFFNLLFKKRKAALPCTIDTLKPIHYLLISHDHRDHFDTNSVEILVQNNPEIEALIPLRGSRLFRREKLKNAKIQEAGWYQEYKLRDGIRIIFLPARHWGRRGFNDFNQTLWGSFLIITHNIKLFFAGDTAYDDKLFKEIRELFGNIDICLLPIGAYSPAYIMKSAHLSPEEAAQVFLDLGGKWFIPMHYGTYDLSDEPLSEPVARLQKCGINNHLKVLAMGEKFYFGLF